MADHDKPFIAATVTVGRCDNPECRGVHLFLLDEASNVRASAAIPVEDVMKFCGSIDAVALDILGLRFSKPAIVGHA